MYASVHGAKCLHVLGLVLIVDLRGGGGGERSRRKIVALEAHAMEEAKNLNKSRNSKQSEPY
jgi:hypothetical protein